jgi:hypothetical protein
MLKLCSSVGAVASPATTVVKNISTQPLHQTAKGLEAQRWKREIVVREPDRTPLSLACRERLRRNENLIFAAVHIPIAAELVLLEIAGTWSSCSNVPVGLLVRPGVEFRTKSGPRAIRLILPGAVSGLP